MPGPDRRTWGEMMETRNSRRCKIPLLLAVSMPFSSFSFSSSSSTSYSSYSSSSSSSTTSSSSSSPLPPPLLDLLPATNNTMKDVSLLLTALENNVPFGFAHFNDGELQALDCNDGKKTVFAWMQACTPALSAAMRAAMTRTAPNFYLGLPCNCEFRGRYFLKALQLLNVSHGLPYTYDDAMHMRRGVHNDDTACPAVPTPLRHVHRGAATASGGASLVGRITVAPLFINGNYLRAKKELVRILTAALSRQRRRVHAVVAAGRQVGRLPVPLASVQRIAQRDAFEANYTVCRTDAFLRQAGYADGDVVMIMAGPLGRILASEWTWLRPRVTFLELGSFWDVELWDRPRHRLGLPRPCSARTDTVGLSCSHPWAHSLLPEELTRAYLC